MEELPFQVGLPSRERRLRELPIDFLHELRLLHVERDLRDLRGAEVGLPVEVRDHLAELAELDLVVGRRRVAQRDVVERGLRELLLEREDRVGGGQRRGGVESREREHVLDVRAVLLARLDEARLGFQVVVPIGHPEPRREDIRDHARRIMVVGGGREAEGRGDAERVEATDHLLEVGGLLDPLDLEQHRPRGGDAELVDRRLVHAGGVGVADELLVAARRPVLPAADLLEDLVELVLVELPRGPAAAPAVHERRDRVVRAPVAVRVLEEVRAGIDRAVEVADLDAALVHRAGRG